MSWETRGAGVRARPVVVWLRQAGVVGVGEGEVGPGVGSGVLGGVGVGLVSAGPVGKTYPRGNPYWERTQPGRFGRRRRTARLKSVLEARSASASKDWWRTT